ncbi:hypothetical protein Abu_0804 [Aliarcobacter butzleri RM4018]|uniref:Uncharacterized protein n=1 Tax=Aliarcobacter butzleri (strain RM4018) TaxID=367737 RepID=A8ESZ5_ALIB4|nr:hypothetical protein [Aliarcobacter butzleri]ABV67069.1 hypothetical protein Abu_0804 [Aliarcobacter butzleri RM4018]GGT85021.1 hypothetical protein GCM10007985_21980 [Aliarcobacter butzleri]SNV26622.1 Uncharacterised protein [Aliarcobacter butzleri]
MNIIKSKLTKINSNWNEYYFIKEFFQKKINFTDEVKTNYYGDLNNYLHDTLSLVKSFKKIKSDADYISQIIVLLQVIYTQQDLIDELLYIFKLAKSTNEDKNPNRDIRNELIGHPISRNKKDNNKLKSSILFDIRNRDENYISYAKYSMRKSELKKYSIDEIIENHKNFLNKYLDKILNKIEKEIKEYKKTIEKVFNIPLINQFEYIDRIDKELLSSISYIFEKESLKYYYQNRTKHIRYSYCLEKYERVLKSVITGKEDKTKYYSLIEIYDEEQLYKKDKIFTIDFYIEKYKDNEIVLNELNNMKKNINNNAEYYSSLNFLCENEKQF